MSIVMPKNTNKTKQTNKQTNKQKTRTNLDLTTHHFLMKKFNYFNKFCNLHFSTYCQILLKQRILNQIRQCLGRHIQIWHHFFYQKTLKYSNDLQNRNFSVLWLKWIQTMEMKQNQTFFHGTYLNLTPYLFLSKSI